MHSFIKEYMKTRLKVPLDHSAVTLLLQNVTFKYYSRNTSRKRGICIS